VEFSVIVIEAVLAPEVTGTNVTEIVQVPPALTFVPHVLVSLNSAEFAPVIAMLEIVRFPEPGFERAIDFDVLVVPVICVPKASDAGVRVILGRVPVPLNEMLCGLPTALSVIERLAVRWPVAVGRNVMLITQLTVGASVAGPRGQLLDSAKSA
jgi:hypothetical protein